MPESNWKTPLQKLPVGDVLCINGYIFTSVDSSIYHPLRGIFDEPFLICSLAHSNVSEEALHGAGIDEKRSIAAASLIEREYVISPIPSVLINSGNVRKDAQKSSTNKENSSGNSFNSQSLKKLKNFQKKSILQKHSTGSYTRKLNTSNLLPVESHNIARGILAEYCVTKTPTTLLPLFVIYQGPGDFGPSYIGQSFTKTGYSIITAKCHSNDTSFDENIVSALESFKAGALATITEATFTGKKQGVIVRSEARYNVQTRVNEVGDENSLHISGELIASTTGVHNIISPTSVPPAGCNAELRLFSS